MPLSSAAETELRQMLRDFRAAHSGAVAPTGEGKALEEGSGEACRHRKPEYAGVASNATSRRWQSSANGREFRFAKPTVENSAK